MSLDEVDLDGAGVESIEIGGIMAFPKWWPLAVPKFTAELAVVSGQVLRSPQAIPFSTCTSAASSLRLCQHQVFCGMI